MIRERVLKVVLVLVGLLFSAAIYPLTMSLWKMNESDYGDDMMLSLYFALGIFLLMPVMASAVEDKPATRPAPIVSPEVHGDRTVTFRLLAPAAKMVRILLSTH